MMSCNHAFKKTGEARYTLPGSHKWRCVLCGVQEWREDPDGGIKVLTGLEAFRMRPTMCGLTQEQADAMKCAEVKERHPDLIGVVECNDGWVYIQHPLKPLGVAMQVIPCGKCNYDQRFPFPQPVVTWSVVEIDGENVPSATVTISDPESNLKTFIEP